MDDSSKSILKIILLIFGFIASFLVVLLILRTIFNNNLVTIIGSLTYGILGIIGLIIWAERTKESTIDRIDSYIYTNEVKDINELLKEK